MKMNVIKKYSLIYRYSLIKLERDTENDLIARTSKNKVFNRKGYCTYFDNILINIPAMDCNKQKEYSGSLSSYLKNHCDGDVRVAINNIDNVTKSMFNINKYEDNIREFTDLGSYLRDILLILERPRDRDSRRINIGADNNKFCLLCYSICEAGKNTCIEHTNNGTNGSAIKHRQRMINKVYDKVYPSSDLDGLSRNYRSRHKRLSIEYWSQTRKLHNEFSIPIRELMIEVCENESIPLLHQIIFEHSKRSDLKHMNKIFPSSLTANENIQKFFINPLNNHGYKNISEQKRNALIITMYLRMNMFKLIELEYKNKDKDKLLFD